MNDINSEAPDRSFLYRCLGLLLIGIGAFLSGYGMTLLETLGHYFGDLPSGVVVLGAIAIAGMCMGTIFGAVLLAVGCAVLGALVFGADTPLLLSAAGVPCMMVGIGLRIFNPF